MKYLVVLPLKQAEGKPSMALVLARASTSEAAWRWPKNNLQVSGEWALVYVGVVEWDKKPPAPNTIIPTAGLKFHKQTGTYAE